MINNENELRSKIYIIRGVQVMLDSDLAEIYGYTTKAFIQQIKRNIERFDEDFMFQITKNELKGTMMSKFSTSRYSNMFAGNSGGTRKLPYAFTEQDNMK